MPSAQGQACVSGSKSSVGASTGVNQVGDIRASSGPRGETPGMRGRLHWSRSSLLSAGKRREGCLLLVLSCRQSAASLSLESYQVSVFQFVH